jgi:hypothetical protein
VITAERIAEITQRLVEFYRPERIYLFGSEARGDAGPERAPASAGDFRGCGRCAVEAD